MPQATRSTYLTLWVFAIAFGWIEGAVVVYLRAIDPHGLYPAYGFPLVSLPASVVLVEIVREACTLFVLGAAAWLTSPRPAARIGAFLLLFGLWDLVYYAVLRLVSGWPASLGTWDILFLIPVPWLAPVWAPVTVATLFVVAGTYLFWTADKARHYGRGDVAILLTSMLVVLAAFLADWHLVLDRATPQTFPLGSFWAGVVLGVTWFAYVERRAGGLSSFVGHG